MENVESNWNDIDFNEPVDKPDTGDDTGDDLNAQVNPPTTDVNGNPIIPAQGLESSLPGDDDDDDDEPPVPGDGDGDGDDTNKGANANDDPPDPGTEGDPPEGDPGTEDQSGIELYLAQFDIEGGMINFEDGTSKHFDEIDAAKQAEVLQQLHGNQATSVEEKYGLAGEEIGLINYLRENKLSVQDMVENMAKERVETLMALQQSETTNYSKMSDDAVYTKFLKETSPEDTPEEIETKLEDAKKIASYGNLTGALRTQYEGKQSKEVSDAKSAKDAEVAQTLETQRKSVVEAVVNIKDVAGVELNDNIKNSVLDRVLEVDDSGDSLFMSEVFGNPEKLFKAAFWYYYGDNVSKQRDDYWKKEKSAAYKRGKSDALGYSKPGQSFVSNKNKRTQDPIRHKEQTTVNDWEFEE